MQPNRCMWARMLQDKFDELKFWHDCVKSVSIFRSLALPLSTSTISTIIMLCLFCTFFVVLTTGAVAIRLGSTTYSSSILSVRVFRVFFEWFFLITFYTHVHCAGKARCDAIRWEIHEPSYACVRVCMYFCSMMNASAQWWSNHSSVSVSTCVCVLFISVCVFSTVSSVEVCQICWIKQQQQQQQ